MKRIVFVILLMSVVLFSCDTTYHETIPYKKVDFTIYPNETMYWRLNTYGGHEYFTGGVAGIVVYRLDEWSFYAYDRACSYDWENIDSWIWVHHADRFVVRVHVQHPRRFGDFRPGAVAAATVLHSLRRLQAAYI